MGNMAASELLGEPIPPVGKSPFSIFDEGIS
jgi:hypothetical protein